MRISGRAGRPRGCAPPASVAPHARPLRWGPGVGESTFGGGGRRQRVHVRGLPALHHRLAQDLQVRVRGIVGRRRRPPRGAAVLAGREDGGRGGGAHAAGWTARPGISFQRAGLVPAAPSGPGAWPAGGVAGRGRGRAAGPGPTARTAVRAASGGSRTEGSRARARGPAGAPCSTSRQRPDCGTGTAAASPQGPGPRLVAFLPHFPHLSPPQEGPFLAVLGGIE